MAWGKFKSVPACRLTRSSTAQTFARNAFTPITFDSEAFDTDSMHSTTSNTSRITINTAGVYSLNAHINSPVGGTATQVLIRFIKNGSQVGHYTNNGEVTNTDAQVNSLIWEAVVGDYFEASVYWYAASGGPYTFSGAGFSAVRIGAIA